MLEKQLFKLYFKWAYQGTETSVVCKLHENFKDASNFDTMLYRILAETHSSAVTEKGR